MKFIVKFHAQNETRLVAEDLSSPGMDVVDDVRENLGKNIPLEQLEISCPYYGREHEIAIPESAARLVPYFNGNTKMHVTVPNGFFSRYLMYKPVFDYNSCRTFTWVSKLNMKFRGKPSKGTKISVSTVLDAVAIINDWLAAGHPTEWRLDD